VSTNIATSIMLDENTQPQIRLNFNITLTDLPCDYVSVDVWDSLGTNRQNVTKNVDKWQLDADGVRRIFSGRNRDPRELVHDQHDMTLKDMHFYEGVHATELTKENFKEWLEEHEMAFVDFFAPWCVWCQRLAPTWEKFAQEIEKEGMPVGVGTIDCVKQADLCREQRTMAFPTLRWYHDGAAVKPDYKMDRTVSALIGFAKRKLEMDEKFKAWNEMPEVLRTRRKRSGLFQQMSHPACQVSGHFDVNRVPGNFHSQVQESQSQCRHDHLS
jgi:protein disulfide-isomerase-like protein